MSRKQKLNSTPQTCLILRIINRVSMRKGAFPPYEADLIIVFTPSKSYADADIYAELRSLREEHVPTSMLEAAESREEGDGLAFLNRGRRCCL